MNKLKCIVKLLTLILPNSVFISSQDFKIKPQNTFERENKDVTVVRKHLLNSNPNPHIFLCIFCLLRNESHYRWKILFHFEPKKLHLILRPTVAHFSKTNLT